MVILSFVVPIHTERSFGSFETMRRKAELSFNDVQLNLFPCKPGCSALFYERFVGYGKARGIPYNRINRTEMAECRFLPVTFFFHVRFVLPWVIESTAVQADDEGTIRDLPFVFECVLMSFF